MDCLQVAELLVTHDGVAADGSQRGPFYAARYRFRGINCNKPDCGACPHGWYALRVWRVDGKQREKYLGAVEEPGDAYEKPTLRAPKAPFGQHPRFARPRGGKN